MKLKKEYVLLLLAIVVLSVYLFMRSEDQSHFEMPELAQVDSESIDRLVVSKGDRTVELQKKDDHWVVGPQSYKGDSIKIQNMVRSAADLTLTALVSESGNLERYGLSDNLKINVHAYSGEKQVREFDIGRRAPTNQHTFVALTGSPKVYHARGNIDGTYDHTVDELRDETVLAYDQSEITTITLTRGEQSATFARQETAAEEKATQEGEKEETSEPKIQWVDADGNTANTVDVDRLINSFAKLKCDDYLADDAKADLKDPLWTVTLKGEQASHQIFLFAKSDPESIEFPATSSGSPYAFILHKTRVENYEKEIDRLLTPKAATEPEKK